MELLYVKGFAAFYHYNSFQMNQPNVDAGVMGKNSTCKNSDFAEFYS
jgi:hypothetical protein